MKSYILKFIHIIRNSEPALSVREKAEMWTDIVRRRKVLMRRLSWAACVAVVVGGAALAMLLPGTRPDLLAELPAAVADSCASTCVVIGNHHFHLAGNVTLKVMKSGHRLKIQQTGESFEVLFRDDDRLAVTVPDGLTATVRLADGSVVSLHGGSRMASVVGNGSDSRSMALDGEAYLNVFHDASRPFTVQTHTLDVRVLGTEFIVNSYSDRNEKSVTLISGRVEVTPEDGNPVVLQPTQTFRYESGSHVATMRPEPAAADCAPWKDGLLVLDRQPLVEVLQQVARTYNIDVRFNADEIGAMRLDGKLDIQVSAAQLFKNIERIAPVEITFDSNHYTVKAKNK